MLKRKSFFATCLLLVGVFCASLLTNNAGATSYTDTNGSLYGDFTYSDGSRWVFYYWKNLSNRKDDIAEIAFVDRNPDATTLTVPSLSEVLAEIPGSYSDLQTYFVRKNTNSNFTKALDNLTDIRTATSDITTLDLTKTTKGQIESLNGALNNNVEVNVIFGEHMVLTSADFSSSNPYYFSSVEKGLFEDQKIKVTNFEKGTYFGARTFKNAVFNESNRDMVLTNAQTMGYEAFYGTNIKTLNVNSPAVGSRAFMNCKDLTSVTFGSDIENIWGEAFASTTALEQAIVMPVKVKKAEYGIFRDSAITSVDLKNVTNVWAEAFYRSNVNSVNFGEATVINFRGFADTKLTDIDFSVTKVKQVLTQSFENAQISSLKLDGVEEYDYRAFAGNKLTSVYLPKSVTVFSTSSVFEDNNVSEVTVAYDMMQQRTGNMTHFKYAFGYNAADNIKKLNIVAAYADGEAVKDTHVNTLSAYYGYNKFSCVYSYYSGCNQEAVLDYNAMKNGIPYNYFYGMERLEEVVIGEGIETIGAQAFFNVGGALWGNSNSTLKKVVLPNTLKAIGDFAFMGTLKNSSEAIDIVLPDSLQFIGTQAFMWDTGVRFDFDSKNMVGIGDRAFYQSNVHNVALRDKLKYFGGDAFYQDSNIHDILIDFDIYNTAGVKDNPTNNRLYMFGMGSSGWSNDQIYGDIVFTEKSVTNPNPDNNGNSYLPFAYHIDANSIDLSAAGWTRIGNDWFNRAKVATSFKLPHNLERIQGAAFHESEIAEEVVLPDSIKTIDNSAFLNSNAKITHLPTSLETIGNGAFYNDVNVTADFNLENIKVLESSAFAKTNVGNVVLNNSLTRIGYGVFHNDPSLTNVTINFDLYNNSINYTGGYESFFATFGTKENQYDKIIYTGNVQTEPCGNNFSQCGTNYYSYFYGVNANEIDLSATGWKHTSPSMFMDSDINTLKLPAGLKQISDSALYQAKVAELVEIPDSVEAIDRVAFQWSELKIDQLPESLKTIGDGAFYGVDFNANPVVPSSVELVGLSAFHAGSVDVHYDTFTFNNDMTMNNTKGQVVEAFMYGSDIDTLYINSAMLPVLSTNGWDRSEFYNMSVDKVVITALPNITANAFKNCSKLVEVDLSEDDNLAVIQKNAFYNDYNLNTISFSEGLKDTVVTLGESAFAGTGFETIGDETDQFDLTAANFDASAGYVFSNMPNLTSTLVPVQFSNKTVPEYTFFNDDALERVDVDYRIETIDQGAFADNENLAQLFVWGKNTEIVDEERNTFEYSNMLRSVNTLYFVNGTDDDEFELSILDSENGLTTVNYEDFTNGVYEYYVETGATVTASLNNGKNFNSHVAKIEASKYGLENMSTVYMIVDEDETITVPKTTDIYAYAVSEAEEYSGSEQREDYEGDFYPLDEVLYLTTNHPIVNINEDGSDFDKSDLIVYALRRDGVILESDDWKVFTTAYPRNTAQIYFAGSDTTSMTSAVYDAPIPFEEIELANENFVAMTYSIGVDENDEQVVYIYYTDKYTESVTDADLAPEVEEEEPEEDPIPEPEEVIDIIVPNTGKQMIHEAVEVALPIGAVFLVLSVGLVALVKKYDD